jgi:hypothetical protein
MTFAQCEKYGWGLQKFTEGFLLNILPDSPCSETLTKGHLF